MTRQVIRTDRAPPPLAGYSQAVRANDMIFVSGQGPFDTNGNVVGDTIQDQTGQCLRNVEAILAAAGSSLQQVVSATFILAEESDFAGMNEEWAKWFPVDPPARQGATLPFRPKDMKVSIAVVALAASSPVKCTRCGTLNDGRTRYCARCGADQGGS